MYYRHLFFQRLKQEAAMNVMRDKLTAAAAELEMVDEDGNPIGPDPDDPPEGVITETVSLFPLFS